MVVKLTSQAPQALMVMIHFGLARVAAAGLVAIQQLPPEVPVRRLRVLEELVARRFLLLAQEPLAAIAQHLLVAVAGGEPDKREIAALVAKVAAVFAALQHFRHKQYKREKIW